MASYSYPYGGNDFNLLTTLFIAPSTGCFDHTPTLWKYCWTAIATATASSDSTSNSNPTSQQPAATETHTSCYWPLPSTCWPADLYKATTYTVDPAAVTGQNYAVGYGYSPGVLPPSFQTLDPIQVDAGGLSSVFGCYSGWRNDSLSFCTSPATASHVLSSTTMHGPITALLPQIIATWASSDLPYFTPKSAPLLPPASISSAVAAAAASSARYSASYAAYLAEDHSYLSTADKAGIGVGVGVGVLLILGGLFFWWRLRRKRRRIAAAKKAEEEKGGDEKDGVPKIAEARSSGINQLPNNSRIPQLGDPDPNQLPDHPIQQLDAANEIHELPNQDPRLESSEKAGARAVTPSLRSFVTADEDISLPRASTSTIDTLGEDGTTATR